MSSCIWCILTFHRIWPHSTNTNSRRLFPSRGLGSPLPSLRTCHFRFWVWSRLLLGEAINIWIVYLLKLMLTNTPRSCYRLGLAVFLGNRFCIFALLLGGAQRGVLLSKVLETPSWIWMDLVVISKPKTSQKSRLQLHKHPVVSMHIIANSNESWTCVNINEWNVQQSGLNYHHSVVEMTTHVSCVPCHLLPSGKMAKWLHVSPTSKLGRKKEAGYVRW